MAEAEQKIAQLHSSSNGLLGSVKSDSQISEVNLEQIIADVISNLMTDEGFLYLIQWLDTLPSVIHGVSCYLPSIHFQLATYNFTSNVS